MNEKFSKTFAILLVVVSFTAGALGGGVMNGYVLPYFAPDTGPMQKKIIEERVYVEESDLISAREKVAPAVFSVVQLKDVRSLSSNSFGSPNFFFDFPGFPFQFEPAPEKEQSPEKTPEKQVVGGGTAFLIESDGLALTNKHVVDDPESEYLAVMNDGTEYSLEIVGKDPLNDVAVVRVKSKEGKELSGLPTADLGDSDVLKIGQRVLAIGNALAEYENTTTSGIISATGRDIVASDSFGRKAESLTGLIQTDAAINPGNSGGPLVNLAGQVVGINTAIDTQATGVSFALPINDVKSILASIEKYGKIVRPVLGVRYIILTEEKAKELGLSGVTHGAFLVGDYDNGELAVISGGPADKAGLQVEDVILEVDGESIDVDNTLQKAIRDRQSGDKVMLKVWRKGKEFTVEVTLGTSEELQLSKN